MVNHLLANLIEAGILGQIRDVTVHLTIHLDVLHHRLAIGLQTTVKVVQVLDAANLTGCRIEELRRQGLREGVIAFLLIATHQVVTILLDHTVQFGNLIRRILQISIHRDNHITLGLFETAIQGRTLTVVPAEFNTFHARRLAFQVSNDLPRLVGRAVVHEDHLITIAVLFHHPLYPGIQFWQRLGFIIKRYNNWYIHLFLIYNSLLTEWLRWRNKLMGMPSTKPIMIFTVRMFNA